MAPVGGEVPDADPDAVSELSETVGEVTEAIGEITEADGDVKPNGDVSEAAGEVAVSKATGEVAVSEAAGEVAVSEAAGEVTVLGDEPEPSANPNNLGSFNDA